MFSAKTSVFFKADVEGNLLCEEIKSLGRLLDLRVGV